MKSTLPRIACFHGGGSTAPIFKLQCTQLERAVEDAFKLVYFDGPFTAPAGAGILPAFRDFAPFKSWFTKDAHGADYPDGSGYDSIGRDGVERVWKMMEEDDSSSGSWVGVLGFSQGTRIASGLLLDQQRRKRMGELAEGGIELLFGVIYMGAYGPMESEIAHRACDDDERISIPTIHVHGLKDAVLPLCRENLAAYFDSSAATLFEINYHHAMPWAKGDAVGLANRMREMYGWVK
ncbi:hypothetical protein ASPWEDRAFT_112677 [Aspergillus wentii DTO 134E9]|uniref:Serine hydrolase domain-containing protein n=1 Tax=Aspergillus wentii DTO 134E9 TaxID=1073089 RepID=A0A1L9RI05_ASPWE|nr:uncharacterized protein ASPWEDRAFT_112677 [Aspergillus wentii DTO 134E9]OJJ34554.1 hypothetical protein ASPWEDRAFT_112677 [Aspergillus wentii DTO 134E9]